ncbi:MULTISPECIES: DUF2795 domain-containing protein [Protofrankia]|uniref:DUF2795 domain-containing protein n=1 Tax=Protofrankia coriariae TaxID=1562887 RepID=A0ABR5F1U2_9ACTN|nr:MULTISPECIES: DUF2795 domain-containing protein [Protofrankia]KLL10697.1 hypothetical protein FrCorBMG51_16125 [Protofrankia coriariae]ONH34444.1 hypothetical protein BL254_16315 [Protofrankia sp. BMG5.30]
MSMQRGSTKHGPAKDDNLAQEVDGIVRARRDTRTEEWRSAEPPGEDQPQVAVIPERPASEAAASTDPTAAVEARSELARWFDRHDFPARAAQLAYVLRGRNAPEQLVERLAARPKREQYDSFGHLWRALHGGEDVEAVRF